MRRGELYQSDGSAQLEDDSRMWRVEDVAWLWRILHRFIPDRTVALSAPIGGVALRVSGFESP